MTRSVVSTKVSASDALLTVEWDDRTTGEFPSLWLRDNLQEDRDPYSGQRLIDVTELPLEPRIRTATLADTELRVVWQDEARVSTFALDWLYAHAKGRHDGPSYGCAAGSMVRNSSHGAISRVDPWQHCRVTQAFDSSG